MRVRRLTEGTPNPFRPGGHVRLRDYEEVVLQTHGTPRGVGGFGKIAYGDFKFNGQFYPMYGATGVVLPAVGFQSLGGILTSRVAVGRNKDGRLEVFARGTALNLIHTWQTAPNDGWN
jgi:hypothetical protein